MEDRETLRSLIYEAVRHIDDEAGVPVTAEIDASWQALHNRLTENHSAGVAGGVHYVGRRFERQTLRHGIRYALSGAALALIAVLVGPHIVSRYANHPQGAVSSYVTGNGERAKITLPDGNTVVLSVASRLDVPAEYLSGKHTLRLNGEALFTVDHHAGNPLIIVTGSTITKVLGTTFVVRHYPDDPSTTVAVREGRVTVDTAVVTRDQAVEVGHHGMTTRTTADPSYFGFAEGALVLNELRLPQAIAELDRWYDADIRLGDSTLASQGIGGTFTAGSLADLTANLELALNVRVVREGRVLTLYPK